MSLGLVDFVHRYSVQEEEIRICISFHLEIQNFIGISGALAFLFRHIMNIT